MARQGFSLEVLESFSGGLNLRSDQFNLADNESPDMLNVTVDPRGGIRMRDGVDRRNTTALSADVKGMWGFTLILELTSYWLIMEPKWLIRRWAILRI